LEYYRTWVLFIVLKASREVRIMPPALVVCEVSPGLRDSERTAGVKDVNGNRQFLRVPERFLTQRDGKFFLPVGTVLQDPKTKAVLIELPHEADSGANRLWVWPGDLLDPLEVSA
jgi:hypothetical protein